MARHLRVLIRRLAAQLASFDVVRTPETLANTRNGAEEEEEKRNFRKSQKNHEKLLLQSERGGTPQIYLLWPETLANTRNGAEEE